MKQRRTLLATLGSVGAGSLAGCSDLLGGDSSDDADEDEDESESLFTDEFDDETFEDTWEFRPGNDPDDDIVEEREGVLYHKSRKTYNSGADLRTQETFEPSGTVELRAMIRSLQDDYWGYGVALRFEDGGGIELKEQQWGQDDELQIKYLRSGTDNVATRVAGLGYPSDPVEYGFTVDFDDEVVRGVHRGDDTLDSELGFPSENFETGPAALRIGIGRGHEIEYESVELVSV